MTEPAPTPSRSRARIAVLAVPMVAFTIAVYVGNAFAPSLADDAPIALLVLNPRMRWLFLVSARVDTLWFFLIPLARATAVLSVYFLLGRWFGDRALRWLESKSGNALRPVLWIERKFHQARVPVTFFFPGTVAGMLAGADGMSAPLFFAVALTSIGLRVWAVRSLADAFREPLLEVLDWIGANQIWLTLLSFSLVFGWVVWSNRNGLAPTDSVEELVDEFTEPDVTEPSEPSDDVARDART